MFTTADYIEETAQSGQELVSEEHVREFGVPWLSVDKR
jgi:hypothetical protein